jgi:hypothetical protein
MKLKENQIQKENNAKYFIKMASDSLIGFCEIKRKPDSN